MYFKDFPKFLYDFNYGNGVTKTSLVKDITRNIRFRKEILSNITLYDEYDVIDGETPEIIAEKFYGSPQYHWVVMLTNEQFDYISDYPLMEPELQKHIISSYNPTLHAKDWTLKTQPDREGRPVPEQIISFFVYDNSLPLNPSYLTYTNMTYTLSGSTTTMDFEYTFSWPDIRAGVFHNGFDEMTQIIWQVVEHNDGKISCNIHSDVVTGVGTTFSKILVGMDLRDVNGVKIGRVKRIVSNTLIRLEENAAITLSSSLYYSLISGTPVGELTIATTGRENNPVYFVNEQGYVVQEGTAGARGVTGAEYHRAENDKKRRIKLISPKLLATVLRNYKELL